MKDFRDLQVWQKAHALALAVYRITSTFPSGERFALTLQLRRAAVSISANIAEGCGRSGDREFARFLQVSLGSASEVQSLLLLARDLGFLEAQLHAAIEDQTTEVKRMLAGLLGRLQSES